MAPRRRNSPGRWLIALALIGAAIWLTYRWRAKGADSTDVAQTPPPPAASPASALPPAAAPAPGAVATVASAARQLPPKPPLMQVQSSSTSAATADVQEGMRLLSAGQMNQARTVLSRALSSGALGGEQADRVRQALTGITDELIFSPRLAQGVPHVRDYRIKPGDTLQGIALREQLDVPYDAIQLVNGISDPRRIQVGQRLKLVEGPFNAIVTRDTYRLDIYHHGLFVRSYPIGLGQNGSTPTGRWIVKDGGRVRQAPWYPPAGADETRVIECGQPGYPLGKEGLWIALTGLEPGNETFSGFGIHGTNEPDSIGKQASLGCVRLRDADIAQVFAFLQDGKSQVLVR